MSSHCNQGYSTKRILRLISIRERAPEPTDFLFQPRDFIQTQFPKKKPDSNVYRKQAGNRTLVIASGYDSAGNPLGIPYGPRARLIMMWLAMLVKVQTDPRDPAPRLSIAGTYTEFLRSMGYEQRGRAWRELQTHLDMFLNCQISVFDMSNAGNGGPERRFNRLVSRESQMWFNQSAPEQQGLWPNYIQLTAEFTDILRRSPIPVDIETVKAFKDNALALDLYAFLSHASFTAWTKKAASEVISWRRLHERFGEGYTQLRDFRKEAIRIIERINVANPWLQVDVQNGDRGRGRKSAQRYGGIIVQPSRPHIMPKHQNCARSSTG